MDKTNENDSNFHYYNTINEIKEKHQKLISKRPST